MAVYRRILQNFIRFNHTWCEPQGFRTDLNIYNCIEKEKVPFVVRNEYCVSWYTCGPTVYDSTHIGHASCYIKLDILQKILKNYFKLNVVTAMNITDVDDKILAKARTTGFTPSEIACKYETEFWDDLTALNIDKPNFVVRVTENVDKIIHFIKRLIDLNKAYVTPEKDVCFNLKNYSYYGKLQKLSSTDSDDKDSNPQNFTLWKSRSNSNEITWESPWGPGRPGWHIECSTLASSIFGKNIDVHAGGIDLRFPHHENEEAQSCAYHDTNQWVNYWVHPGILRVDGADKMSKSLKNTISVQKLLETVPADVFRMACVMTHYRSPMVYSKRFMFTAQNVLDYYKNFLNTCRDYIRGDILATIDVETLNDLLSESKAKIYEALCDDFDTPKAINILNNLVSVTNSMLHQTTACPDKELVILAVANFVLSTMDSFGLLIDKQKAVKEQDTKYVEVVNILTDFRNDVRLSALDRKDKDMLQLCDEVRNDLKKHGIILRDHGKKSSWNM